MATAGDEPGAFEGDAGRWGVPADPAIAPHDCEHVCLVHPDRPAHCHCAGYYRVPASTAGRGMMVIGLRPDEQGRPVLLCLCDCGLACDLTLIPTTRDGVTISPSTSAVVSQEVAYTCDSCGTSHWMTISPPSDAVQQPGGTPRPPRLGAAGYQAPARASHGTTGPRAPLRCRP